jgi:cell division protein ZapA (FtsZ GTPase activity inhibitor)
MTEEQKEQLNEIAKQLGGKLEHWVCSTLHTRHKKIVITYDAEQK